MCRVFLQGTSAEFLHAKVRKSDKANKIMNGDNVI